MLVAQRRISEGPGTLSKEPRAFNMRARLEDAFAFPLCPQFAALSSATCEGHEGRRAELSALQLSALRAAGAHLSALRPWQSVLRRGVRAHSPR